MVNLGPYFKSTNWDWDKYRFDVVTDNRLYDIQIALDKIIS